MHMENKIDEFINIGKWIKNDIGMGRVQCSKIVKDEKELAILIVSDTLDTPIAVSVEKILVVSNEIIIFYDGQYVQKVEKSEYERYKQFLSAEEWNIIFKDDVTKELIKNKMISEEQGFYVAVHETLEKYMKNGYDEKLSNDICHKYNI